MLVCIDGEFSSGFILWYKMLGQCPVSDSNIYEF